ncbi:MAG TPA: acyl-CoA thioesterase, partial [Steroidobacteraceae bacterium]
WHGHYAKYLELARCQLLKRFDYNYDAMTRSGFLWPVVDLQLRFLRPLRFGDRVRVHAALVEWEYRLRIEYLILSAASGARLTKASTVQVAVSASTGEMCLRSPDILFERLGVSP